MILILTNYWDYSSQELIKYFDYIGFSNYQVINTYELFEKDLVITPKGELTIGDEKIDFDKIKIVWNRRLSSLDYTSFYDEIIRDNSNYFGIDSYKFKEQLKSEFSTIISFIFFNLKNKIWYPGYNVGNINKLVALQKAQEVGLQIPQTFVINSKKLATENLISKSVFETNFIHSEELGLLDMFTREIELSDKNIPDKFFPSLVQGKINKQYELRVFFIEDEFYAMAVFSQNSENTKVDFRRASEIPTRNVKYNLPFEIKEKLIKMNESLGLRTGSIDMIVTPESDYVFLEINPVGQFGMTSRPCNYNLDFKIAEKLISYYN